MNIVRSLPDKLHIAVSGGIDSVTLLDLAIRRKKEVTLVFFDHDNEISLEEKKFALALADRYNIPIIIGESEIKYSSGSKEKFWRDSRYDFFKKLNGPVATGHTLDDAVEWYLLTCLRGEGHYMTYSHANVIRPLLLTRKEDIVKYAETNNIKWFNDVTNQDPEFTYRNKIRLDILPKCLEINPGLYKTVANKLRSRLVNENLCSDRKQ